MAGVIGGQSVSSCTSVFLVSAPECLRYSVRVTDHAVATGFTPFACEDRHNTKLKILKHRETLRFPQLHESPQPVSLEAFDLMRKILVEKEQRLCSRRYELNDYTRKFVGVSYQNTTF